MGPSSRLRRCFYVVLGTFALNYVAVHASLGTCSFSYGDLTGIKGDRGEDGQKGSPGESCHCHYQQSFQGELDKLWLEIDKLKTILLLDGGWFKASNNWYYKVFKENVDYVEAKTKCKDYGGRLASSGWRDPTVKSELTQQFLPTQKDIWIGLDDIERTNRWLWSDGVVSTRQNTDWRVYEPHGGTEHCGLIYETDGKTIDRVCNSKYHFLCEVNL